MTRARPLSFRAFLTILAAAVLALTPACSGTGQSDGELEAGDPDDPENSESRGGGHRRDGGSRPRRDAGPPDCGVPDAAVPDAAVPDAAVSDAAPPDAAPPDAAVFTCPFGPGEQGCVCGFKDSVPPDEWPGFQIDCDFFGDFCRADCCPPGRRIDASDPTRCVPEPGTAPQIFFFGPWPDFLDDISAMRLNWVVYGADHCRAEVQIDGGAPFVADEADGVGLIAIDELDSAVDQAAIQAALTCDNPAGTASASYEIAAASDRVGVTGLGGGFPQPVEICWAVLPFFATDIPPFAGGQCHVGICPAGEFFDPFSSFPCFGPSFFTFVSGETGCVSTSGVNAVPGDLAYVSCEDGDIQRAVHSRLIEP